MKHMLLALLAIAPVALPRPPLPDVQCKTYWIGGEPCTVCLYPDGSMDLCGLIRIPRGDPH